MSEIEIKNTEKYALVDDEDYERAAKHSWHDNGEGYVRTVIDGDTVLMHRFIIDDIPNNMLIDHINGNKYDNRKKNLHVSTASQNGKNKKFRYRRNIPDGFLDTASAAKMLGYNNIQQLLKIGRDGRLPRYKILGTTCYKEEDLQKILEPRLVEPVKRKKNKPARGRDI